MTPSFVQRFGFDLDNTIIDYGLSVEEYCLFMQLPKLDKITNLRRYLREIDSSDQKWQEAQSWIYVDGLAYARVNEWVSELCRQLSSKEIDLFIVSHKTKKTQERFGGRDLLNPVSEWIKNSEVGKYFSIGANVHFAPTREEKIIKIDQLKLSGFVDDLLEVLIDVKFPSRTKRYLLSQENYLKLPQEITVIESFGSLIEKLEL